MIVTPELAMKLGYVPATPMLVERDQDDDRADRGGPVRIPTVEEVEESW